MCIFPNWEGLVQALCRAGGTGLGRCPCRGAEWVGSQQASWASSRLLIQERPGSVLGAAVSFPAELLFVPNAPSTCEFRFPVASETRMCAITLVNHPLCILTALPRVWVLIFIPAVLTWIFNPCAVELSRLCGFANLCFS